MRSSLWISALALFAAVTMACDDSQRQNCAECRNGCSNTCAPNGGDSGAGAYCSGCLLACVDLCGDCDDEGISQSCSSCNGYSDGSGTGTGYCEGGETKCAFCFDISSCSDSRCSGADCGGCTTSGGQCNADTAYKGCPCNP